MTDPSCDKCVKKLACAACGDQLCKPTSYTCDTKGHYVSPGGPICIECHQLESMKGKIG